MHKVQYSGIEIQDEIGWLTHDGLLVLSPCWVTICPVGSGRQADTCLPLQERYIELPARSNRASGRNSGRKYRPGTSCRYLLLPATSIRPTEILFVSSRPFVFRIRIQSANPSPPSHSIFPSKGSFDSRSIHHRNPACLRGFGDQETGRHDTLNASKAAL